MNMANEYYFPVFDGQQYSGLFVFCCFLMHYYLPYALRRNKQAICM
ncbi:hypothetical protein L913_4236 [Escherichia coli SCD2]|nr:hypothetical protein L913_4236 [Escherichia coli SCD2]